MHLVGVLLVGCRGVWIAQLAVDRASGGNHVGESRAFHEERSTRCSSAEQHLVGPLSFVRMEFKPVRPVFIGMVMGLYGEQRGAENGDKEGVGTPHGRER